MNDKETKEIEDFRGFENKVFKQSKREIDLDDISKLLGVK